ncbi:MAG: hypothetical protein FWE09_06920 [Treponema sp.]|nr:hypothetical protein [Treponema sp.]
MNDSEKSAPKPKNILKFVGISLVGIFLFLAPIPDGSGAFNIPLGIAIDWVNDNIFTAATVAVGTGSPEAIGGAGNLHIHHLIGLIAITISLLGTILVYTVKPKFIMNNETARTIFKCSPVYFVTKIVAFVFIWMIFLNIGPDFIIASYTGDVIIGLVAALVTIFIFLVPAMPLITDFGLMEFIGILIRKAVRVLFTLPGRASVDLMASWFGSSVASVIITRGQHERGYYTGREAASIAVNFSFVSLPFTFVVVRTIGLYEHFFLFLGAVYAICLILAIVMPRLPPLSRLPDEYLEGVGKQINEDVPLDMSTAQWAVASAYSQASKTTAKGIARGAAKNYFGIFMDLLPTVMAWGTLGVILVEFTPIFNWIGYPFGLLMELMRVPEAMAFAHITVVGFIDMFLPALMLGGAPLQTQFILGVLSIVQIIYLAETGVLIIKSKMPLNIGHLAIIFAMRTLIALPLIVLFARIFFRA